MQAVELCLAGYNKCKKTSRQGCDALLSHGPELSSQGRTLSRLLCSTGFAPLFCKTVSLPGPAKTIPCADDRVHFDITQCASCGFPRMVRIKPRRAGTPMIPREDLDCHVPGLVCPGKNGHLDLIERWRKDGRPLIVAVLRHTEKPNRVHGSDAWNCSRGQGKWPAVEWDGFEGLLIDYAAQARLGRDYSRHSSGSDTNTNCRWRDEPQARKPAVGDGVHAAGRAYSYLSSTGARKCPHGGR